MYRVMHLSQLELPVLVELPVLEGLVHQLHLETGLLSAYGLVYIAVRAAFVHGDCRFSLWSHAQWTLM